MTMMELSRSYEESAVLLRRRLKLLRQKMTVETDPEAVFQLRRRIAELTPMLTQMNELAELTARYYERGYWRNEKYTLCRISRHPFPPGISAETAAAGYGHRADSGAKGDPLRLLSGKPDHGADRPAPRCHEAHRLAHPPTGGK